MAKKRKSLPTYRFYVVMTDKFMSGWGKARGKTNKLVIGTNSYSMARKIQKNAKKRPEMIYVNIRTTKPYYNPRDYLVNFKRTTQLGAIWKK